MATRSTAAEVEERIFVIYKKMVKGESRTTILRFAAKEWGVSARTLDTYTARAREWMKDDLVQDRRQFVEDELHHLYDLRQRAIDTGQLNVALGCTNTIGKLAQFPGFAQGMPGGHNLSGYSSH